MNVSGSHGAAAIARTARLAARVIREYSPMASMIDHVPGESKRDGEMRSAKAERSYQAALAAIDALADHLAAVAAAAEPTAEAMADLCLAFQIDTGQPAPLCNQQFGRGSSEMAVLLVTWQGWMTCKAMTGAALTVPNSSNASRVVFGQGER